MSECRSRHHGPAENVDFPPWAGCRSVGRDFRRRACYAGTSVRNMKDVTPEYGVLPLRFHHRIAGGSLLLLGLLGCGTDEEPPPQGPGEIDLTPPDAFEPGPASEEDLDSLRRAACVNVVAEPETPKPSLQFVIDVSGSMALTPPDGAESKWVLTREALRETVSQLPEDAKLGVSYFPNKATSRNCLSPEGACEPGSALPVDYCINTAGALPLDLWGPENSEQRLAFEDALTRVNPAGGTPTHDAVLFALEELRRADSDGHRILVLLTDGQPTYLEGCRGSGNIADPVDPAPIVETIARAATQGIATFVVGVPGSEETSGGGQDARKWLSDAAQAGQTAREDCNASDASFCHFDLTEGEDFVEALDDALMRIVAQSKSCDFPLPDPPGAQSLDPDEVNVLLVFDDGDGLVVGKAEGECDEGYVIQPTSAGPAVHLCPDTCAKYREELAIDLELVLGCESAPQPPPT